jgi:hypothetical protein
MALADLGGEGHGIMKRSIFAALMGVSALAWAGSAQAGLLAFSLGGDGNVSVTGTITVGPDPFADTMGIFGTPANLLGGPPGPGNPPPSYSGAVDPANALAVTGATGTFSDVALGFTNVAITGILATNPQNHFDPDETIPYSFGWYPAPGVASYDNLFYAGGNAPITCIGLAPGGFFDDYGVLFTLDNGALVDVYSIGAGNGPGLYGAIVLVDGVVDRTSAGGLTLAVPEPSTWAMMVLGFAGLGFAGHRKARKAASAA